MFNVANIGVSKDARVTEKRMKVLFVGSEFSTFMPRNLICIVNYTHKAAANALLFVTIQSYLLASQFCFLCDVSISHIYKHEMLTFTIDAYPSILRLKQGKASRRQAHHKWKFDFGAYNTLMSRKGKMVHSFALFQDRAPEQNIILILFYKLIGWVGITNAEVPTDFRIEYTVSWKKSSLLLEHGNELEGHNEENRHAFLHKKSRREISYFYVEFCSNLYELKLNF